MRTRRYCSMAALVGVLATAITVGIAQERESPRPDLSGRWRLNRELSENAEAKLKGMHSESPGGQPAGGHGRLAGLFGGPRQAQGKDRWPRCPDQMGQSPACVRNIAGRRQGHRSVRASGECSAVDRDDDDENTWTRAERASSVRRRLSPLIEPNSMTDEVRRPSTELNRRHGASPDLISRGIS